MGESSDDVIQEESDERQESDCDDESCHDCKKKRHLALLDKLPHAVGSGMSYLLIICVPPRKN